MRNYQLLNILNELLNPGKFVDYCPNGLQIEGGSNINKILCAVSISQQVIDYAVEQGYEAILVHHGLFWHKSPYNLTGIQYQRVSSIIRNNINLYAYHLPLDNHATIGNNVQLARVLELVVAGQTGDQELLWYGSTQRELCLPDLIKFYNEQTGHKPVFFGSDNKKINKVAWCTGGAQNMFQQAIELGVDCYITGEINEPAMALADEAQVAYIAGGHYVTERYGIRALSQYLSEYHVQADYKEFYNPI